MINICLLFQKYFDDKKLVKLYNKVNIWKTKYLEEIDRITQEFNELKITYQSNYDESFEDSDSEHEKDCVNNS
jgi:hypothetical protein